MNKEKEEVNQAPIYPGTVALGVFVATMFTASLWAFVNRDAITIMTTIAVLGICPIASLLTYMLMSFLRRL